MCFVSRRGERVGRKFFHVAWHSSLWYRGCCDYWIIAVLLTVAVSTKVGHH